MWVELFVAEYNIKRAFLSIIRIRNSYSVKKKNPNYWNRTKIQRWIHNQVLKTHLTGARIDMVSSSLISVRAPTSSQETSGTVANPSLLALGCTCFTASRKSVSVILILSSFSSGIGNEFLKCFGLYGINNHHDFSETNIYSKISYYKTRKN